MSHSKTDFHLILFPFKYFLGQSSIKVSLLGVQDVQDVYKIWVWVVKCMDKIIYACSPDCLDKEDRWGQSHLVHYGRAAILQKADE